MERPRQRSTNIARLVVPRLPTTASIIHHPRDRKTPIPRRVYDSSWASISTSRRDTRRGTIWALNLDKGFRATDPARYCRAGMRGEWALPLVFVRIEIALNASKELLRHLGRKNR
jgi:hypothetical protein